MISRTFETISNLVQISLVTMIITGCGGGDNGGGNPAPPPPTPPEEIMSLCNSTTGLSKPLETCTATNVCTKVAQELVDKGITEIIEPSTAPQCRTYESPDHPVYDDGAAKTIAGIDGLTRYYCSFRPATTQNIPLIVFMHPGGQGNAADVYRYTHLRQKAIDYPLTPGTQGFALVSIQGRNLHYPTFDPRDGHHHDFFNRDLNSPSKNPDIANVDAVIDQVVAQGGIDTSRIYIMGWSNGAMFSHLYSIARYQTTTPGGYKIAASATFSGGDPFDEVDLENGEGLACRLDPYPQSKVPQFIVRRNCDAALACNDTQQSWFQTPAGHNTAQWLDRGSRLSGLDILTTLTIDGRGVPVADNSCTTSKLECTNVYGAAVVPECQLSQPTYDLDKCADTGGIINHARWPDGTRDNSGNDYEVEMLEFLANYSNP